MFDKKFNYQPAVENTDYNFSLFFDSSVKSLQKQKLSIVYYTDPLCCACWALEPVIKKLVHEYGDYFNLTLKMGGLLESWENVTENEYSSYSEIESHWKRVGEIYGMPISGKVWQKDPLESSYPPSRAYIAAKKQGLYLADIFFRKLKEAVFVYDLNISRMDNLESIAEESGLNPYMFLKDFKSPKTKDILLSEIYETRALGISSFPTLMFLGEDDFARTLTGVRPYENYVHALKEFLGYLPEKNSLYITVEELFSDFSTLSLREILYLSDFSAEKVISELSKLCSEGYLETIKVDSSYYWKRKTSLL